MVIASNIITAKVSHTDIRTQVAAIMIPFKIYRAGSIIMDYLLLQSRSITNYIPYALKREDPSAYASIINAHSIWMNEHRNIQILNIPTRNSLHSTGKHNITMQQVVNNLPLALDSNYDRIRQRLNISVNAANFSTMQSMIKQAIAKHEFNYKPHLKHITPRPTEDDVSSTTNKSRYSSALSDIILYAANQPTDDQSSSNSNKNPWKRRTVPSVINFTEYDPNSFPPLPNRSPANPTRRGR
jgi:hypothetical protein